MKKSFLFSIRPCLYILLLLLGIAIPLKAAAYTVDGIVYTLYSHGTGDDCVADSAKITGCESTYAGGGIRTSITREYTYSKFIGYDTNNKPIYQTVTRYLTYPVTTMTSGAFAGSNITSFNLPGSIKIESSYLNLSNCKKLTNADIPSTAHYISFAGCVALPSISIPSSITSIGSYAFSGCTSLNSVSIPNSVTSIGSYAFSGCTNLTSATIGESVKTIKWAAFKDCVKLSSITLPKSIETIYGIGNSDDYYYPAVFANCTGLKSVNINCTPKLLASPDPYSQGAAEPFFGCSNIENVSYNCSVVINFFGPYKYYITEIDFPNLTNVTFGTAVDTICDYALNNCLSLTRVFLPSNIKYCGQTAFPWSLERIEVSDLNSYFKMSGVWPGDYTDAHLYFNGNIISEIVVPESIDEINSGLFYGDDDLISFNTNKAKKIHGGALWWCNNLKNLVIGEDMISLGDMYWGHAAGNWEDHPELDYIMYELNPGFLQESDPLDLLTWNAIDCENHSFGSYSYFCTDSLIIGNKVKRIPRNFAKGDFTTLTIPRSVEKIAPGSFDCWNLKTINWDAKDCTCNYYYEYPELPEGFPDDNYYLRYENEYYNYTPFYNCRNLNINIGSGVERIGGLMFKEVGNQKYSNIDTVTCLAVIPPTIDIDCFCDETYNNATLYVPEGSLEAYRNAVGWKEFFKCVVIEDIPGGDDDKLLGDANDDGKVNIDDVTTLISYLLQGYVTPFNAVNADVDEDGSINIADVTALISLLLKSN